MSATITRLPVRYQLRQPTAREIKFADRIDGIICGIILLAFIWQVCLLILA